MRIFFNFHQNAEGLDRFRQNLSSLVVYDRNSSKILWRLRKDEYQMQNVSKEYLVLFNAITDAEESLRRLQARLIDAQQKAEELYIEEEGAEAPSQSV